MASARQSGSRIIAAKEASSLEEMAYAAIPGALLLICGDVVSWANPAALDLAGASDMEQVLGVRFRHFFPMVDDSAEFFEHRRLLPDKVTFQDFTGTKATLNARCYPSERGWVVHLEKRGTPLPSGGEQGDSRLAGLGMLVAGVAHEINNPLTFVIPALSEARQLVEDSQLPLPKRAHLLDLLEEAETGIERVKKIAADLREFKRGDDQVSPTDVNRIVVETLRLAETRLKDRKMQIRHTLGVPTEVIGNPTRMSQVILNLVINAAQAFSPDKESSARISVRTWSDARNVHISVEDNGSGIPKDKLDRIFDPFFSTKNAGTGLGLSVCAGIVKRMGGWMEVDSAEGVGTVFTVVLPVAGRRSLDGPSSEMSLTAGDAAECSAGETSHSSIPPSYNVPSSHSTLAPQSNLAPQSAILPNSALPSLMRPLRILVADDEPLVIRSVQRMMQRKAEITQASGAWEAIALLREGLQVDCIVSDMVMPDGSGMDFWEWVKKNCPGLKQRFFFMTGMAPAEGGDPELPPAIHKPFTMAELEKKLRPVVRFIAEDMEKEAQHPG